MGGRNRQVGFVIQLLLYSCHSIFLVYSKSGKNILVDRGSLYRALAEMSGQKLCFRMISSRRPDTENAHGISASLAFERADRFVKHIFEIHICFVIEHFECDFNRFIGVKKAASANRLQADAGMRIADPGR